MTGQTSMNHNGDFQPRDSRPGDHQRREAICHSGKISDEFANRLAALPPGQQVRAVVLPAPYLVSDSGGLRTRGEERQAIVREARTRTEESFADIDKVLAERGGRRLTEGGNALGFIVVETCPDGIAAIADLNWVGTVMEDQAIRPVHQPDPPTTR
jgi:hypothetical protein